MGNCNKGNCNVELATLPVLSGCPDDNEWFLVGNATGGYGTYRYARRRWADLKGCMSSKVAIRAVVGRGGANDPIKDSSVWQSNDLKGLGSTSNNEIQIVVAENTMSNYGDNTSFYYDPVAGTIDINNGSGNTWVEGSSVFVDLNQ